MKLLKNVLTLRDLRGLRGYILFLLFLSSSCCLSLNAQFLPSATLSHVYPVSCQAGHSVEVTLSGANLDEVDRLLFSHPGLRAAQKTRAPGPFDEAPRPEAGKFVVSVTADVREGIYELRAAGTFGITNPRAFVVSRMRETLEVEPNSFREEAGEVALRSAVTGRIPKKDVDYFRLPLEKGRTIVVRSQARSIDSALKPVLVLYGPRGRERERVVAGRRSDPVLTYTATEDGDCVIKVHDHAFLGDDAFIYRLVIDTAPQVDFILPPAGEAGSRKMYQLYGRNLPGGRPVPEMKIHGKPVERLEVDIQLPWAAPGGLVDATSAGLDLVEYRLNTERGISNPKLLGLSTAPTRVEREPNNSAENAQAIVPPCEVGGQFYPARDRDLYEFQATKGEVFWIDVYSHRLGIPSNPTLALHEVKGSGELQELHTVDGGMETRGTKIFRAATLDPALRFKAPRSGRYRITVRDTYSNTRADPRTVYRLSVRRAKPDFRLVAVPFANYPVGKNDTPRPHNVFLRRGDRQVLELLAFRRDGFDGDIAVSVEGLPPGVTASEASIRRGRDRSFLVLEASDDAGEWLGSIRVLGQARVGGWPLERVAQSGTIVNMRHSRLSSELWLAVSERESAPSRVTAGDGKVIELSRSGELAIPIKIERRDGLEAAQTELSLLGGEAILRPFRGLSFDKGVNEGMIRVNLKAGAPLGEHALILKAHGDMRYARNPGVAVDAARRRDRLVEITKNLQSRVTKEESTLASIKENGANESSIEDAKQSITRLKGKLEASVKARDAATERAKKAVESAKLKDIRAAVFASPIRVRITRGPIVIPKTPLGSVHRGSRSTLSLAVERRYAYAGAFTVSLSLPDGVEGIQLGSFNFPENSSEATADIQTSPEATAGTHPITLSARVELNGETLELTETRQLTVSEKRVRRSSDL